MNKCPPQSSEGNELTSISIVSSISDSVVVIGIVDGGIYVGLGDVVDSYIGHSVIGVDSMSLWPTSITIASVSIIHKKRYSNIILKNRKNTIIFIIFFKYNKI